MTCEACPLVPDTADGAPGPVAVEDGGGGPIPASVIGVTDAAAGRDRRFAAGLREFGGRAGTG